MFQSSGMLTPNTGAVPGTAAYVSNNYLETSGTQIYPVNKLSSKATTSSTTNSAFPATGDMIASTRLTVPTGRQRFPDSIAITTI